MKITEVIVDPLHGAVKHKPLRRFLAFLCIEPLYCAIRESLTIRASVAVGQVCLPHFSSVRINISIAGFFDACFVQKR